MSGLRAGKFGVHIPAGATYLPWTLRDQRDIYVPLVTKGLNPALHTVSYVHGCFAGKCILTGSTE